VVNITEGRFSLKLLPDFFGTYSSELFVDRKEEINNILELIQQGNHRIIVCGDHGSGKTWLLKRVKDTIPQQFKVAYINVDEVRFWLDFYMFAHGIRVNNVDEALDLGAVIMSYVYVQYGLPLDSVINEIDQGKRFLKMLKILYEYGKSQENIALIIDTGDVRNFKLLNEIEELVISPLLPGAVIIVSDQEPKYIWRAPEMRTAKIIELKPFSEELTREQLERQVPQAAENAKEIHQISSGNPGLNYLLAKYGYETSDQLKRVVDSFLENVPNKLRQYLEALCILRCFDEERLAQMLATYTGDNRYLDMRFGYLANIRRELAEYDIVYRDRNKGDLVIDGSVRRIMEYYLKITHPDKWRELHKTARSLYYSWAENYPRIAERCMKEANYHEGVLSKSI